MHNDCQELTLLKLPNATMLRTKAADEVRASPSSYIWWVSLFQHHGERVRLLNEEMNDASLLPNAVNASTVRKTTPPSSLMPPRWCVGWGKHNSSYPIPTVLSTTNHQSSRFLLTSLRIPEGSPRTGANSFPPRRHGCSSSDLDSAFSFSWLWSTFSLAAISLSSRRCWYG